MKPLHRIFFPSTCVLCRKPLPGPAMLCPCCSHEARTVYRFTDAFCPKDADDAAAPLIYKGRVRDAMHRYKFSARRSYADWFAAQAGACLSERLPQWQPHCLTYVPLSLGRWWRRGYNQSALVARLIARKLELPCISSLHKRMFKRPQSTLSHQDRPDNIAGAFSLRFGAALTGKRVVLVDDVVTTGSTASECARMLRLAGASRVYVLSMTKTPVFRAK